MSFVPFASLFLPSFGFFILFYILFFSALPGSFDKCLDALRKEHRDDGDTVVQYVMAHHKVSARNILVTSLLVSSLCLLAFLGCELLWY